MTPAYSITHCGKRDGLCFAAQASNRPCNRTRCSPSHQLRYRCDAIDPTTGAITATTYACINHAAWLADLAGLPFPIIVAL